MPNYKGIEIPNPVSMKERIAKLEETVKSLGEKLESVLSSKVEPVESDTE